MSPTRRVRLGAGLLTTILLSLAISTPSRAQYSLFAPAAARSSDFLVDPLLRSPGLAGMGRLTLVGEDPHHRINLWDLGGNPAGVAMADSVSTLDLRPGAASSSDVFDQQGSSAGMLREAQAARTGDLGYEFWRRQGRLAYGAVGNLGTVRLDQTYSDDVEHRQQFTSPTANAVINGLVPYTRSGNTRYAIDVHWSREQVDSHYLSIVQNGAGDFITLDSEARNPPNVFVPEIFDIERLGAGLTVAQVFGPWLTAAVGYNGIAERIDGSNPDKRNSSETHEVRPYNIGQATLIGRVGPHLEWGVDGRGWKAQSEASWNFTISSGQGAIPLSGRGKLLERDEEGSSMRSRAIWHQGSVDVGAGLNTDYRKVTITPPALTDQTSFNYFLNTVYHTPTADSLALPDSVSADIASLYAWEAGGGLAWHLRERRGLVGIEYHRARVLEVTALGGEGPKRITWDVRTGIEYRSTPGLALRAGYQYRWDDLDDFTKGNEYYSNLVTGGLGLTPHGSAWTIDLSYGVRWVRADYGSPSEPHGGRQQLVSQVHWAF
jgi:hypothetical protein